MHKRFTVVDVVSAAQAASLISQYGSPLYVYKEAIIREKVRRLMEAAQEFKVSYAIKANTNSTLVKLIRELGVHHVDAVSPGEIHKALSCGYHPHEIMYTENFIAPEEIDYALNLGVTLNIGALHTL
jgi:diaminopimelate decarboxylase